MTRDSAVKKSSRRMSKRMKNGLFAVATAVGAALILIPVDLFVVPEIQRWSADPTCDNPRDLQRVPSESIAADASSWLDETSRDGPVHLPALAKDGNARTSWVEGAPEFGVGETLTLAVPPGTDLQLVCIINGYAKTEDLYKTNSRARQLTVTTDRGTTRPILPDKQLEQYASYQALTVTKGKTSSIELTIETYAAGATQNAAPDTSISEVQLWAKK